MGNYLFSSDDRMAMLESRIQQLESRYRQNDNREKYDIVDIPRKKPSVQPPRAPSWHDDLMVEIKKRRKSLKPIAY